VELEVEPQSELNQPRVVAGRCDAAEVAGIDDLTGGWINGGGVEISDRVSEVHLIEEIEELSAETGIE